MGDTSSERSLDDMTADELEDALIAVQARRPYGTPLPVREWVRLRVSVPQPKDRVAMRINRDVLAWFRRFGPGYQTRINAVLRAFVDAQEEARLQRDARRTWRGD